MDILSLDPVWFNQIATKLELKSFTRLRRSNRSLYQWYGQAKRNFAVHSDLILRVLIYEDHVEVTMSRSNQIKDVFSFPLSDIEKYKDTLINIRFQGLSVIPMCCDAFEMLKESSLLQQVLDFLKIPFQCSKFSVRADFLPAEMVRELVKKNNAQELEVQLIPGFEDIGTFTDIPMKTLTFTYCDIPQAGEILKSSRGPHLKLQLRPIGREEEGLISLLKKGAKTDRVKIEGSHYSESSPLKNLSTAFPSLTPVPCSDSKITQILKSVDSDRTLILSQFKKSDRAGFSFHCIRNLDDCDRYVQKEMVEWTANL